MSQEFDCHYGEAEFNTIKAGIEAIEAVLTPLIELLQRIAVTDEDKGIVEEAFHLLEAYTEGPYEILEKNIDEVPEEYKPTALYLLNPNNW